MRAFVLPVLLAASSASIAFAQPEVTTAVGKVPGKAAIANVVMMGATVDAVDAATRSVTLRLENGTKRTIAVDEQVRNFDRIQVGDRVKVEYAEALALELKKGGKALVERKDDAYLERSKPGEKPGGKAIHEVTVVADVVGTDAAKMTVSLRGPKGNVVDLTMKDPEQFKLVKTGDQVEATYTEAVAIRLDPAAK
jgi:hypothetical protein